MILLTKLDNQKILVNLETIKYLEEVPDTLIFFTNGDSVMVQESMSSIADLVTKYQASIVQQTGLLTPSSPSL